MKFGWLKVQIELTVKVGPTIAAWPAEDCIKPDHRTDAWFEVIPNASRVSRTLAECDEQGQLVEEM